MGFSKQNSLTKKKLLYTHALHTAAVMSSKMFSFSGNKLYSKTTFLFVE